MKIINPFYEILTDINNTTEIKKFLEQCTRTAYQSHDLTTKDSHDKLLKIITKKGHLSVLEHFSISVKFVSNRGFTHELVRHRLASFTQESTRYCSYNKDKFDNQITYIKPLWLPRIQTGEYSNIASIWKANYPADTTTYLLYLFNNERKYMELTKIGWKPEEARDILPNALKAEIVMTANLREWKHIFKLRANKHAHPQMQQLMKPLYKEFKEKFPIIF